MRSYRYASHAAVLCVVAENPLTPEKVLRALL